MRHATFGRYLFPREGVDTLLQRLPIVAVLIEKRLIVSAHFANSFCNAIEHRQIAANVWLDVKACDIAAEQHATYIARYAKLNESRFDNGIHHHHFAFATP